MTTQSIDTNPKALQQKLLEINVWAMLLILALVLEQTSSAIVLIAGSRNVDTKVWAAVFIMGLVFGLLLATTVGILALHVRFGAVYRYWYVILDNVFVTVPLYLAVRFIATSIIKSPLGALRLDESMFRIGAWLIFVSLLFLFARDLIVLPKISRELSVPPLVAVGALHLLGAMLFLSLAIAPKFIMPVAVLGAIGLGAFFTGMAAIPFIETRFAAPKPAEALAPRVG
jgi:hypothetical protein